MRTYAVVIALFAVLAISGCSSLPYFGSDTIKVDTKTVENGQKDVIVVKDIQTIPRSPLLPDQQMILSFVLENKDTLKEASGYVDLFNAPTMHGPSGDLCNLYSASACTAKVCSSGIPCQIDADCNNWGGGACRCVNTGTSSGRICTPDVCGEQFCTFLPGEEKPVNFVLRTPSEDEIKNIKTDVKLDMKTVYSFSGALNFIVPAVNMQEIIRRQRSGETTQLTVTKSYGSGPVQIEAEIQGAPYVISNLQGPDPNPETVINFKIRNRGSGNVENSEIPSGMMQVTFPPELIVVTESRPGGDIGTRSDNANDKFTCSPGELGTTVCVNNRIKDNQDLGSIPLYLDESRSSIRFAVKMKETLNEPFRSVQITADVNYNYELRNSVDVTINAFQNV